MKFTIIICHRLSSFYKSLLVLNRILLLLVFEKKAMHLFAEAKNKKKTPVNVTLTGVCIIMLFEKVELAGIELCKLRSIKSDCYWMIKLFVNRFVLKTFEFIDFGLF